ncbi:MAG TPA: DUF2750 domain-containing protein [Staphylococcus sp.]|nr:DUF2750 domain-containing protein [Staphylococcus sp.]
MSYKENSFFQEILVNETFYVATKSKELVKHKVLEKNVVCAWSTKAKAETFLKKHAIEYDHVKKIDIDRFVTYEMDDLFEEGEEVLADPTDSTGEELVNIVDVTNELMSDLDNIRLKEFVKDTAKEDAVFGLSRKNEKQFILISDDEHERPHIMPVWSIKSRAEKVRDEDFEECEIIEVEGEVFADWLDNLRDDNKAVAIDLKSGVVGTVVSAQKVLDQLTY